MSGQASPITVLMADDDDDDRDYLKRAWIKSCVVNDLRFVEDGEELMDYLRRRGRYLDPVSAPRPGLILLDLNRPRKNGREALLEIKSDAALQQIPVIVPTTSQMKEDILCSYDLGASYYITKPVTLASLLEVIQVIGRHWGEMVDPPPDAVIVQEA
ncbi:MAG TPA: response regulator [Blastocatellia bacterium]|nr:response regulator [Blastocatellia bacterium]